ncbi:MAG: hypothetical protein HY675_04620 [Chloroflexi bacterium]|nr:hypothetical protein [Chloroflexota bacterium]
MGDKKRGTKTIVWLTILCFTLAALYPAWGMIWSTATKLQNGQAWPKRIAVKLAGLQKAALSSHGVKPAYAAGPTQADKVLVVYADSLIGWDELSWNSKVNYSSTAFVHSGKYAISFTNSVGWAALSITPVTDFDTTQYTGIRFYVNGGTAGNQKFGLALSQQGEYGPRVNIGDYAEGGSIAANEWRLVDIPLSELDAEDSTITRLMLQDTTGATQPTVYLDDIEFYHASNATTPSSVDMAVSVEAATDVHAISPLIYGVGYSRGAEPYFKEMGVSVVRWGGNARTRHNWEINASNAGSDWEFRNLPQAGGDETPGKASLDFVTRNRSVGAESFLTIPTIGWVAKDGNNATQSINVPRQGGERLGPESEAIAGYDPTENRNGTSMRSYARKGSSFSYPPDTADDAVFQDEWVNYLVSTFRSARMGGIRLYAMDNEMDLWADDTHADVAPVRVGYDDALSRFIEYADAVKAVDLEAEITGPVISGWSGLWYSALDRGNDAFLARADRMAHGDAPFLIWFLRKVREHDAALGRRTLDVLDVHHYPSAQGVYSKLTNAATQALRLRSTQSLWSPTYAEESWVANTRDGPNVQLIPRLKEWIAAEYPDTKIGISEWNWGADGRINGALAIADVLGIFGREGVYLANYWTAPPDVSPGYWAWRMYRNYDGAYSRFGDVSVRVRTSDDDRLAAYASRDSATGELKVVLINKMPVTEANVAIDVRGFEGAGKAAVYEFSKKDLKRIVKLPDVSFISDRSQIKLSPYSITLVVVAPRVSR